MLQHLCIADSVNVIRHLYSSSTGCATMLCFFTVHSTGIGYSVHSAQSVFLVDLIIYC